MHTKKKCACRGPALRELRASFELCVHLQFLMCDVDDSSRVYNVSTGRRAQAGAQRGRCGDLALPRSLRSGVSKGGCLPSPSNSAAVAAVRVARRAAREGDSARSKYMADASDDTRPRKQRIRSSTGAAPSVGEVPSTSARHLPITSAEDTAASSRGLPSSSRGSSALSLREEPSVYRAQNSDSRPAMIDAAVSRPAANALTVGVGQAPLSVDPPWRAQQTAGVAELRELSRAITATQHQPARPVQPQQPRQPRHASALELQDFSWTPHVGQTANQYARSMRIEARAKTLRMRLFVLTGFSLFSLPLFVVGGAAGLTSSLPYLVTDCTNINVFIFLRVQRARLTYCLTSLTAALCFALVPVFLFGTLLELDAFFPQDDPKSPFAPPAPPAPPAPSVPSAPPGSFAPPPPPAYPHLAFEDAFNPTLDAQSAFTASAIDYIGIGVLALLASCAAKDLIREAQRPSAPEPDDDDDEPFAFSPPVPRGPGGPEPETERESGLKGGDGSTCSICLDTIQPSQVARELPCSHTFHRECIRTWVARRHNCPECRAPAPR